MRYADELGLDVDRFHDDLLKAHAHATRIAQDVESADLSAVSRDTPTFFINGQRHYGAFDLQTLTAAIKTERDQLASVRPVSPALATPPSNAALATPLQQRRQWGDPGQRSPSRSS